MNTNYYAAHNFFSRPAQNVNQLRAGLSGGSFGKGSTAEQGEASALMEEIERYSGGNLSRRRSQNAGASRILRRSMPLLPTTSLLFSDAQSRPSSAPHATPGESAAVRRVRSIGQNRMVFGLVAARRALQIFADQPFVFFLQRPCRLPCGFQRLRGGNTLEEAIVQGFLETGGTGRLPIWWYNRLRRPVGRPQPVQRLLC